MASQHSGRRRGEIPRDTRDVRPRVLVVDNYGPALGHVARVLAEEFNVTGLVLDAASVVERWQATRPDVIVLDLATGLGFEAAARLHNAQCDVPLVFLSSNESPEVVRAAWEAGGRGVVSRRDVTWDLVPGIRSVLRGRRYLSTAIESR